MKTGYSLLLGEFVGADVLEYRDCERFQITCPACREPVFKVGRDIAGSTRHYLSHYRADKSFDADCELRVSGLRLDEMERQGSISREQRLEYFLKVLREAALDVLYPEGDIRRFVDGSRDWLLGQTKAMSKPFGLRILRSLNYGALKKGKAFSSLEFFRLCADSYLEDYGGVETEFSWWVQTRIAYDIVRALGSDKHQPLHDFLWNSGYLITLLRFEAGCTASNASSVQQYERLSLYLHALFRGGKSQSIEIINKMRRDVAYPPFTEAPMDFLGKGMAEISHEMIGILLRIPYLDLIRRGFQGARP